MRTISIFIATMALPVMGLAQAPDQQQGMAQSQPSEEKAPSKKKKAHPGQDEASPQAGAAMHQETKSRSRPMGTNQAQAHSSTKTQTKVVNKEQFKASHREVFTLGRHPKEFFIQRYGANHFRLIGQTYFVFVDGCWVAVDVAGFTFVERTICEGDPDFVVVY